jgi:ATP-dependent DNA ligase
MLENLPLSEIPDVSELYQDHYQLCYKVFDILFLKGRDESDPEMQLMGRPLMERKELLEEVITEIPNTLEIVRGTKCFSIEEVMAQFEKSIQQQEEGVIIKDS